MIPSPSEDWLPNDAQRLFLQACLAGSGPGWQAFQEWQLLFYDPVRGLQEPAAADPRLLGLLHRRFRNAPAGLPRELAAVLRVAAAHEQLRADALERAVSDVFARLEVAGVGVTVLGGVALAFGHYPEPPLRHCHDVDLLIEPEEVRRSLATLDDLERLQGVNPVVLRHSSGTLFNLHASLYPEARRHPPDDVRRRLVPVTVAGRPAYALEASDELVRVCARSGRIRTGSLVSFADAWFVIEGGGVDWGIAVDHAVAIRCATPTLRVLSWLDAYTEIEVPEPALRRLGRARGAESARTALARHARVVRNRLVVRSPSSRPQPPDQVR